MYHNRGNEHTWGLWDGVQLPSNPARPGLGAGEFPPPVPVAVDGALEEHHGVLRILQFALEGAELSPDPAEARVRLEGESPALRLLVHHAQHIPAAPLRRAQLLGARGANPELPNPEENSGARHPRYILRWAHQNTPCSLPGSSGWIANGITGSWENNLTAKTKWAEQEFSTSYGISEHTSHGSGTILSIHLVSSQWLQATLVTLHCFQKLHLTQNTKLEEHLTFFPPSFTSQSSPELCWTLHHLATGSGTTSHSSLACFRIFTKVDFPAAVEKQEQRRWKAPPQRGYWTSVQLSLHPIKQPPTPP